MTDLMAWRSKPARRDEEGDLHRAIIQHLRILAPKNVIFFHPPNNVPASKRTGARFKALGVLAGVPDIVLILPDGTAAFLELKSKAGRLSPAQKEFAAKCELIGVPYAVSASLDECIKILVAWGALPASAL